MMLDPNKLESLIKILSYELARGFNIMDSMRNDYVKHPELTQQDAKAYVSQYDNAFNEVYYSVVNNLRDFTGESHYIFQFQSPKREGVKIKQDGFVGEIQFCASNLEDYLQVLSDIIRQLEEKVLIAARKEIAEKEYDADIFYRLDYHPQRRVIMFNNIEWHTLSLDSTNHKFFEYLWARPNQVVAVDELRQNAGIGDKKVSNILSDMGFVDNIKMIFFPQSNDKGSVQILPIIRKQDIYKNNLPILTREDILALAKKKSPPKA